MMKKRNSALLTLMAASTVPSGAVVGGLSSGATASAASSKAAAHKYTGSTVDTRWGPLQVTITVKSKKITNVKSTMGYHTFRSQMINTQALPMLKEQVLQAQSANIDGVSGATDTSNAFMESLQSAIKKAQKAKTFTPAKAA